MRKFLHLVQALVLAWSPAISLSGVAQTPPPSSQKPSQETVSPDLVVRISTRLVQVDAVVVDKDGKLVTDLKAEDFRVLENGKEQKITHFSFIGLQPVTPKETKMPELLPPARIKPEQVRRTIALIADDLGLSFESTVYARNALKKFVDEQMQPGDLVAIIRSSAGNGALQQFTTDKRLLHAAIDRIRWYPLGRGQTGVFEPVGKRNALNSGNPDASFNAYYEQVTSVGTIGAVRYVIDGLRDLPGRKSVVLLSDGLPLFPRVGSISNDRVSVDQSSRDIVGALNNLTDRANRASVVIYTVDVRGLQTLGLNAGDDIQASVQLMEGVFGNSIATQITPGLLTNQRAREFFRTQGGLNYLSSQTGGFFFHNNNDIAGGLQQIVDDQRGFYLIGYEPDDSTFNEQGRRTFHKLQVQVKTPKLRVRSRTGFFGVSDEEAKRPPETREQQLRTALASPFQAGGIEVNLTSLFSGEHDKHFIRSLIHVNSRDLTFTKQENGDYLTAVDVAAMIHDVNGILLGKEGRAYTLRVRGADYESALRTGIAYALDVPIQKPGAYQLRLAVLDEHSKRIGSATQFIEVPDLGKNHLALSGISLNGEYDKGGNSEALVQAGPALRRMRRGMVLNYGYAIYNIQLAPDNRPSLTTQIKLFYDGQPVLIGKEVSLKEQQTAKTKRIFAGGSIDLGANLKPGEYLLQVIVNDLMAKEKHRTSTQWINFEIVN
ncbi:MAG TPA: VWA domain-containing protein [Blastocatellia bacterium]|nr:VWA domain-containing protein [Blastocatellia bacterium]HMV81535.1 VWA domain-containing protein [Blastocatellia bacterium]HMX25457.1 VWA domain-containing protein [Blastocatellia bacterium]HMY73534.1 VWA domain-containing protein [Blastocatellia bacterium]HMZ17672.1 VWA domain-containing protein [Blastocatellia bacterium]